MKLKTRERLQIFVKIGALVLAVIIVLSYLFSSFLF